VAGCLELSNKIESPPIGIGSCLAFSRRSCSTLHRPSRASASHSSAAVNAETSAACSVLCGYSVTKVAVCVVLLYVALPGLELVDVRLPQLSAQRGWAPKAADSRAGPPTARSEPPAGPARRARGLIVGPGAAQDLQTRGAPRCSECRMPSGLTCPPASRLPLVLPLPLARRCCPNRLLPVFDSPALRTQVPVRDGKQDIAH
jgi:hypothetical protein